MKIAIAVTGGEASMISYALREIGNRRMEQWIDTGNKSCQSDANTHYDLADRIDQEMRSVLLPKEAK
jgi:hypothetical protein